MSLSNWASARARSHESSQVVCWLLLAACRWTRNAMLANCTRSSWCSATVPVSRRPLTYVPLVLPRSRSTSEAPASIISACKLETVLEFSDSARSGLAADHERQGVDRQVPRRLAAIKWPDQEPRRTGRRCRAFNHDRRRWAVPGRLPLHNYKSQPVPPRKNRLSIIRCAGCTGLAERIDWAGGTCGLAIFRRNVLATSPIDLIRPGDVIAEAISSGNSLRRVGQLCRSVA